MGVGPIPVDRIVWYGRDYLGLVGAVLRRFKDVIRRLDNVYIAHERARQPKQPGGKGAKQPTSPVLGRRRK